MGKPKDELHLNLPPQTLTLEAANQDSLPVTPINRSFTDVNTNSFVTAILSPSSHDVFAARARARSRSDAPPPLSSAAAAVNAAASRSVHYSPSLDSISVPRSCDTITEGETSPYKLVQQPSKGVALKSFYGESPSLAHRSRLLSSTGTNVKAALLHSLGPLTLQHVKDDNVKSVRSLLEDISPSSLIKCRPRASTLSIPTPSQYYPTARNLHLLNGSSVTFPNVTNRLRSFSHYEQDRTESSDQGGSARYALSSLSQLQAPWSGQGLAKSSSSSDQNATLLSTKSSHGSLESHYNSSFESSNETNDLSLSLSNSFSETYDTSHGSVSHDSTTWTRLTPSQEDNGSYEELQEDIYALSENLTGASSNVSVASHSTLNNITSKEQGGRPKSHTISSLVPPHYMDMRVHTNEQGHQDVFGPTKTLLQQASSSLSSQGKQETILALSPTVSPLHHLSTSRGNKPRRLTIGGCTPPTYKGDARVALYQPRKPSIPLSTTNTPNQSKTAALNFGHSVSSDQSAMAFQELIGAIRNERAIKSNAIEDVTSAEPQSIGAVLEYKRHSPTGHCRDEMGKACELCGAVAGRLTMLQPCGHLACAVCCSSGLDQVTATPPRPHTCASCHTPVEGITLRKTDSEEQLPLSNRITFHTPRGHRHRPQTPSPEEQKMLYRKLTSSSPVKSFVKPGIPSMDQRRRTASNKSAVMAASSKMIELINEPGEMTSSDIFTEDQSFYQSQHALHSMPQLNHRRRAPSNSLVLMRDVHQKGQDGMVRSTTAQGTSIVRIDNIPWTVTYNDVIEWLPQPFDDILPCSEVSSSSIHVPIDVFTGKTSNCCFVECKSKEEAMRLVRHRNNHRLLGRPVSLMNTTLDDLLDEIFPARAESLSLEDDECIFFTAVHLRQLVDLLQNGGAQLKGPLKIVDVTTSMIRLVPANMSRVLSEMLFHRAREIVCICIAVSQDILAIRDSLDRLLLACSSCACFSVNQRIEILESARGTLTAVTQVKQISSPFLVPPSHRLPAKESILHEDVRRLTKQRSRISSESRLVSPSQSGLAPSPFSVDAFNPLLPWQPSMALAETRVNGHSILGMPPISIPPFAASQSPLATGMSTSASPPSGQRFTNQTSQSPVESQREAAFQTLLRYGISPTDNAYGFDRMVNQLAQAFAKQQFKP